MISDALILVVIYCDSMTALAYVKDPKYHEKFEHVETNYHYLGYNRTYEGHLKTISLRVTW